MHDIIHRRDFIKLAAAMTGTSLLARPALAASMQRGFTHGVASGDPDANSVVLWTRYVGDGAAPVRWQIAQDMNFISMVQEGTVIARPEADYTTKAIAENLPAGQWFYYRFKAPDGSFSDIGRTRTLPEGRLSSLKLAVFSCANLPFGYFNAYGHAAAQNDFDLAVHLGDYFYEYPVGTYPSKKQSVPGRHIEPQNELIQLADYRLRYNSYRLDPDLQALHRNYPMINVWDDHEIANDSWQGGAQNHDPATEGAWSDRKRVAKQAYFEWLPMRNRAYGRYNFGDLASVITLDTRLTGRTRQYPYAEVLKDVNVNDQQAVLQALRNFRDGIWSDETRTMLGQPQESWLDQTLATSRSSGQPWQIIAQQVIVGRTYGPKSFLQALPANTPDWLKARVQGGVLAANAGLPVSVDSWCAYPAARTRLLNSLRHNADNALVLAGDSHNAWAYDLYAEDEQKSGINPAAVEFAGHSVSSPGLEGYLPIEEKTRAQALIDASPEMRWANTTNRGYMAISLTRDMAQCEWRFTGPANARQYDLIGQHSMGVRAKNGKGTHKLETV